MGLMDKVKNLFTEEVEVEEEVKEQPIKKETIHVEIPAPVRSEKEEIKEEIIKPKEEKKEDFNFPFFDDDDFNEVKEAPVIKEEKREPRKKRLPERREKPLREVYSPPKEEKKVFKPTPIISPVYGILDKNYQKDDIKTKPQKPRSYYNPKEATVDEIRNKAYGTLEEDIETTLFGRNRLLFDDDLDKTDIIDEVEKKDISEDYDDISLNEEKPRHGADDEPEITDLLEAELGKDELEEKPHKISDSELFSMIDSMYQKGGKNDD